MSLRRGPNRGRFALVFPFFSPQTPDEHAANLDALSRAHGEAFINMDVCCRVGYVGTDWAGAGGDWVEWTYNTAFEDSYHLWDGAGSIVIPAALEGRYALHAQVQCAQDGMTGALAFIRVYPGSSPGNFVTIDRDYPGPLVTYDQFSDRSAFGYAYLRRGDMVRAGSTHFGTAGSWRGIGGALNGLDAPSTYFEMFRISVQG